MSKTSVGEVYAKVIRDVVENSRIDFEEGGVEATALELLQSEWQTNLSKFGISQLPWETQGIKEEKPTPAKQQNSSHTNNGTLDRSQPPPQATLNTLPPIKNEMPQYPMQAQQQQNPQQYSQPPIPQGRAGSEAAARAAGHLQGRFGEQASQQIARLNGTLPPQGNYIKQEDGSQYQQPIKTDQTDGSGDALDTWQAEYARRKAIIAKDREHNDSVIRDHVLATQQQLEGGGLLLPLDEHPNIVSSVRRRATNAKKPDSALARSQGDAADDDDEEDEDAINSDLDDPDEFDDLNNHGDEESGKVMLCTYDKVQRVKNKWKCILKDGILKLDQTEYLFHKGTGELEW